MSEGSKPMTKKPNILMIVTDQEYAHQPMPAEFALPSRDRIRARGVTFNHHHCTTTVCTPSRSVMLTGRHTPHTRMFDNTNYAWIEDMKADPNTLPTIGHMLRELGYHTVYKGKWHLSEFPAGDTRNAMEPYGFSDYQSDGDAQGAPLDGVNKDPKIATEAVEWLSKRAPEVAAAKPWFMAVNFVNPHDIMYFDTDAEDTVQVKGMMPIFSAPDTPLYRQKWSTTLPASFFDDLEGQPAAVRSYKRLCDMAYGRIPRDRRDMWHNHVNYYLNCHLDIADPRHPGGGRTDAVGSHLDLVPTILAYAGLPEAERRKRYPLLKGHDLSGVVANPASVGPRGNSENPGKGCLLTYDMVATIDGEWITRNAVKVFDQAAHQAGVEFHRGLEAFKGIVDEIGVPNLEKRELFRGVFDGRYKLVRYFGLGNYNLPASIQRLLADNDVALYDLLLDPEEMDNLANPAHPKYDEKLLSTMNQKLNALIAEEVGEDKALFTPPKKD